MKKKISYTLLIIILFLSLLSNGVQYVTKHFDRIYTENSNSRDTYFSIHNISEAHQITKGEGVKVGILDNSFAISHFNNLFAGGIDFGNNQKSLEKEQGHGWQMAATLREIAPECEIFALNISMGNEAKQVDSIIAAIEWAVQNDLDILTLSQAEISEQNRDRLDAAVNKAVENGIVTTFIHYDNPVNLLPYSVTPYHEGEYSRTPDINVYHYDYNCIWSAQIQAFENRNMPPDSGNDIPYFSFSSMSPVTAGFVALLMSIDSSLSPAQYKQILIDTSYAMDYTGIMEWETGRSEHTVDIMKAVTVLLNMS